MDWNISLVAEQTRKPELIAKHTNNHIVTYTIMCSTNAEHRSEAVRELRHRLEIDEDKGNVSFVLDGTQQGAYNVTGRLRRLPRQHDYIGKFAVYLHAV